VAGGPPEDPYARGARLFDEGAFFDAHEAWEERWLVETDPGARRFLQGLIQVAAGFHKLVVSGSPASASRLLDRGLAKLDACPEEIAARGLAGFREGVRACRRALARSELPASAIPKMARRDGD
jgi:predicted metal-dependent hydrolase